MIYVFDTSSFIVLSHYFPERFPTFWANFEELVNSQRLISVREVFKELDNQATKEHLRLWLAANKNLFIAPTGHETRFVSEIFAVQEFQTLIKEKDRLSNKAVADPFVIAAAKVRNACVVTEERKRENGIRIPNVCEHFGIDWTNLEGLMEREDWKF